MKLATSLLLMLIAVSVNAQIGISGIVKANVPIHGADVFLKNNEHVGVLTDTAGFFHLRISGSLAYDTLVILAMGFERKEVPLSGIDMSRDTLEFFIDQQSILLDEVLVESDRFDVAGLVLKAIARIPDNYPRKRHQLIGLYRKVSTDSKGYTHLQEASEIIEDGGYQNPPAFVRIRSDNFRETRDFGSVDSSYLVAIDKMHLSISEQLNAPSNPINRLYARNFLRNYAKPEALLNLRRFEKIVDDHYTFRLFDIDLSGSDTIYHIAFASSVVPPAPVKVSGRNYMKINAHDLAIVEMQITLGFENQGLMSQDLIRFEKRNGKYYPACIKTILPRQINRDADDGEYDIRTLWITDVRTRDFERMRASDLDDPNDPQGHKRRGSSGFWDTAALLHLHPLDEAIKNDLEARQALDEQFRDTRPDR